VLCSELLEHVLDPELSIAEIARVTRPGGVLVLTAPMMWYLHREPNDFYRFTNYGLCHLLSRHGFRVVEMKSTGGIWLFLSTRLLEELHRMISVIVAPPFVLARWVVGWEPPGRGRLASLLLLPLNVALSGLVLGLDRLSRKDVLGWVVLARRSIVTDWAAGSTSGGGGSGTVNALRRCEGRAPGGAPNLSARRPK
jgi:SAM-dependent methyltransferase